MNALTLSDPDLLSLADDFFSSALQAELGVLVETNSAYRSRMLLYRFRAALANLSYANIEIRISPDKPETDLWILNPITAAGTAKGTIESTMDTLSLRVSEAI